MNIDNLTTLEAVTNFMKGSHAIGLEIVAQDDKYQLIETILTRFAYQELIRADRGTILAFLRKVTGFSRQQLSRLVKQHRLSRPIKRKISTRTGFVQRYTNADIRQLARIDELHRTPNGARVKKLCERAYLVFNDGDYKRLSTISVSHIYNLRQNNTYKTQRTSYTKTKPSRNITIGKRKKPEPDGIPGYIRIDTVHQGDLDGIKGVYHINAVDEVTQFEVVISVEKISEICLIPALRLLLKSFPFRLLSFHSDNGSEYINQRVATLLNKLNIEMTKSRPRHSNDNALAESKNASVVRTIFGYSHIPQHFAARINEFNHLALNPYINYHRPCLFPTLYTDKKGKQKKKYLAKDVMVPYDKLKSLPNASQYLKDGITFEILDDIALAMSDNEAAALLNRELAALFKYINEHE